MRMLSMYSWTFIPLVMQAGLTAGPAGRSAADHHSSHDVDDGTVEHTVQHVGQTLAALPLANASKRGLGFTGYMHATNCSQRVTLCHHNLGTMLRVCRKQSKQPPGVKCAAAQHSTAWRSAAAVLHLAGMTVFLSPPALVLLSTALG